MLSIASGNGRAGTWGCAKFTDAVASSSRIAWTASAWCCQALTGSSSTDGPVGTSHASTPRARALNVPACARWRAAASDIAATEQRVELRVDVVDADLHA